MEDNRKIKKDIILINKMCTGSYTVSNIGHEIINYFKDDNGDNYIYILPYGGMAKEKDDRIDTIILTSSLSNNRVEILAVIEIDENGQIHKGGDQGTEKIHKEQLEKLKNVTYGGATLEQIFKYNIRNDKAIYVTFKTKKILKPKDNVKIYISNNEKDNNDDKYIIKVEKSLPSSSLKGYFIKDEKGKNGSENYIYHDYDKIKEFINNNREKLFEMMETPKIDKEKINNFKVENINMNYLQLIEKEDEEQIYTNLFYYWLNSNNLINKFIKEKLNIEDEFELKKEKSLKHGRMDLFAISKDKAIIIENKIQSGLNGIDKDEGTSQLKNYIEGINKDYKIDENKIYGVIFIPDYNVNFLNKEMQKHEKKEIIKYYTPITYSELFEFFNRKEIIRMLKKDLYFNGYYEDFLRCIKNHTFSNISEKNKTEMERKFIYAIKKALEN